MGFRWGQLNACLQGKKFDQPLEDTIGIELGPAIDQSVGRIVFERVWFDVGDIMLDRSPSAIVPGNGYVAYLPGANTYYSVSRTNS